MRQVVIVDGVRTAVGRFGGSLRDLRAQDLGGVVLKALVQRTGIDPEQIDEVVMGNCHYNGYPGVARLSMFKADLPETIPAHTVERQCASGLLAVTTGADMIAAGNAEVIAAGGTEAMSSIPYFLEGARWGLKAGNKPLLDGFFEGSERTCGDPSQWGKFLDRSLSMGITAENVARKHGLTREEQDEFAAASHQKAAAAIEAGYFADEIVGVEVPQKRGDPLVFEVDEGVRADSTAEKLGKLRPAFVKDGTVTAGNSSPLNDGAGCVLMMSVDKAKELGLEPRLMVGAYASAGLHPAFMGLGPVPAIGKLMAKTGAGIKDFDLIELNEAFAAQSLGVVKELGFDQEDLAKVNVNGGAIALGHALANSGVRLIINMMNELTRRGDQRGLVSLCVGGGQGMAMMFERA